MINFDQPSPLPLVTHWPDEVEKHDLIAVYFRQILTEGETEDLIVSPRVLAGGAKHHIRKRAEQAAHSARITHHGGRRDVAFSDRLDVRTLQDQSKTQIPTKRMLAFVKNHRYPSLELFATSRVGQRGLSGGDLTNAAVKWTTAKLSPDYVELAPSDPPVLKIPGGFSDLQRMESIADVTLKTHLARYVLNSKLSVVFDLKARHVGVIPISRDRLTPRERLYIDDLAYTQKKVPSEELSEPKEVLRQLVARDIELPDEERLLEPSMIMIYLCRSGLGAAQSKID